MQGELTFPLNNVYPGSNEGDTTSTEASLDDEKDSAISGDPIYQTAKPGNIFLTLFVLLAIAFGMGVLKR